MGHALFALYGPNDTDSLNRIRYLSISNDADDWSFSESGNVQPYEELEAYKKGRIQERLTLEMLGRYCRALAIDVDQLDFYGPRGCVVRITGQKHRGTLSMSIAEANSRLNL